jgi:hypothetical protein
MGDGGRPFFTLTMTMTLTMTDYPTPAPPLKGAGSLFSFLYHFREVTKMVNLKAYFVRKVEINDKV